MRNFLAILLTATAINVVLLWSNPVAPEEPGRCRSVRPTVRPLSPPCRPLNGTL